MHNPPRASNSIRSAAGSRARRLGDVTHLCTILPCPNRKPPEPNFLARRFNRSHLLPPRRTGAKTTRNCSPHHDSANSPVLIAPPCVAR